MGAQRPMPSAEAPAFVSVAWLCDRLGLSMSTFYARRPAMEAEGFPRPDPIIKRYLREDVEAWLRARRTISDDQTRRSSGINLDALS